MNSFGLGDDAVCMIKETFRRFDAISEAVIFGSRAMGNFKKGSDIDIALKGKIDLGVLAQVKAALDEELPLPYLFDLIDYHMISNPDLKRHIDEHGKVMYRK